MSQDGRLPQITTWHIWDKDLTEEARCQTIKLKIKLILNLTGTQ